MQLSNRRVATKQLPRCNKAFALLHLGKWFCMALNYSRLRRGHLRPYFETLHEGDLLRCFRNSASVTYASTLPAPLVGPWCPACTLPSSSGLASHPSFKVSAHLIQMCENGTSFNILLMRTFWYDRAMAFLGIFLML